MTRSTSIMPSRLLLPLAIFAAALTLYIATLAPTVQWGDFGGFQTRVTIGELERGVFGHPLWNLLARPFVRLPFGDAAFRVNLSSAVFASLALVVFYAGVMDLTRSVRASALAVLALALSHTFWTYAVVPKAYSLTLLMLALCIWLLLRWRTRGGAWRIALTGALLGLGVMNHLIVLTALPGFVLFVVSQSRARGRMLAWLAAGFTLGLLPYLYLLSGAPAQGASTGGFIVEFIRKFIELLTTPRELLVGVAFTLANFGYQFLLLTPVCVWGWWRLWRDDRALALLLALIALGDVAFVIVPMTPPIMQLWHLYHPAYLAAAYALGYGLHALLHRYGAAARPVLALSAAILVPVLLIYYLLAPQTARAVGITERLGVRDLPGRDTVTFLFVPSKAGDDGARRYGETVLHALPANAVLFADWTPYAPLWYLQAVEGLRPDVTVLELPTNESLRAAVDRYRGRRVYLADVSRYYEVQSLQPRYRIAREGLVYRVVDGDSP